MDVFLETERLVLRRFTGGDLDLYHERFPGYGFWAAVEKATGQFLGWFHLRPPEGANPDEPELGARRVYAETMAVNRGSRRVMEKAGLRLVRRFHQPWPERIEGDEHGDVEYALTRAEWEELDAGEG
jgi:hypothetical protein